MVALQDDQSQLDPSSDDDERLPSIQQSLGYFSLDQRGGLRSLEPHC